MTKGGLISERKENVAARQLRSVLSRFRFRALSVLIGSALLPLTFPSVREPLINQAGRFLIDSEQPQRADLIYVLGGNYLVRAPAAAALFRQGIAPRILLAREPNATNTAANFTDVTQAILLQQGVPAKSITQLAPGAGVRSTADEARVLRLYLEAYPHPRVLVVTSAFHSRRARLAMGRAVPNGVRVLVVGVNEPDCPVNSWRNTVTCRQEVKSEWEKLIFYFCTFHG